MTVTEHRLVKAMSPEQAIALAHGADPASLVLADGQTVADLLKSSTSFDIRWWTVESGGARSTVGSFQMSGTIGQSDAGTLSAGSFVLAGGFWGESNLLFANGFETGGTEDWTSEVP